MRARASSPHAVASRSRLSPSAPRTASAVVTAAWMSAGPRVWRPVVGSALHTALTATGTPNAGDPYLLLVFAAIALGGTSFAGGRGGVAGPMLGALTLTLLQKVLFSTGVSSFYTGIFQGVVMIVAVVIAAISVRFSSKGDVRA